MQIRPATPQDAGQICDIWNAVIRDTLITFTSAEKTQTALVDMIHTRGPAFLVSCDGAGAVTGFATYDAFRAGPGYARTKEHTIMLSPSARGFGTGREMMQALEKIARANAVHSLIGGISAANPDGVAFHRKIGFSQVGVIPQTGFKAGQWIDLVLMQKFIAVPG
jgi:L-amino acid N-acyltransferase YncA